jgi:HPt (histidine-containing phosphotransfer) domain-containing protein
MGKPAADAAAQSQAPSPASIETVIDFEHLARMTFGERNLEREVLALFDRQAGILLSRMQDAPPSVVAAYAHTLKGSARGIGAWRVAAAADAVEMNAIHPDDRAASGAVNRLYAAVDEAKALIADFLRPCGRGDADP